MVFSKRFPKEVPGSLQPVWEEVTLSAAEEEQVEEECRQANFQLMDECLQDAKMLAIKNGINTDENRARLATALFEKKASHVVFWKEAKAKEKFGRMFRH